MNVPQCGILGLQTSVLIISVPTFWDNLSEVEILLYFFFLTTVKGNKQTIDDDTDEDKSKRFIISCTKST